MPTFHNKSTVLLHYLIVNLILIILFIVYCVGCGLPNMCFKKKKKKKTLFGEYFLRPICPLCEGKVSRQPFLRKHINSFTHKREDRESDELPQLLIPESQVWCLRRSEVQILPDRAEILGGVRGLVKLQSERWRSNSNG